MAIVSITPQNTAAGSVVLTPSSGAPSAGDVVILVGAIDFSGDTFTFPGGFTQPAWSPLATAIVAGQAIALAYKVAGGSEPTSYTINSVSGFDACGVVIVLSGRHATDFLHRFSAVSNTTPDATPWDIPSAAFASSTAEGCDILFIAGSDVDTFGAITHTSPSGFSAASNFGDTIRRGFVAYKEAAAAGETGVYTGTGALTGGNANSNVYVLALAAAGGGGGTVETWHPTESAASGSNHGALSLTPPGAATSATGHTVGATALDNYSRMAFGVERAAATFGGTAEPSSGPDTALGDCFRTPDPKSGSYAAGDWTLSLPVRASTLAAGQDGRWRVRLWRSANADGSGATEITSGATALSEVTDIATGADSTSAGTIALGAVTLTNEYLFVQLAWHVTGAAADSIGALPTYVSKGAFASGTGALTPAWGAGHEVGDYALLIVTSQNQSGTGIATPSGWTPTGVAQQALGDNDATEEAGEIRVATFYRFATSASEGTASVADTGALTTAQIHVFRGVHPTTPVHVSAVSTQAATASASFPGVTTTIPNCLIVHVSGLDKDAASTANFSGHANAALGSITERHDQTVSTVLGAGQHVVTGTKATAGATGNTTATQSATVGAMVHQTLALSPVVTGAAQADVLLRMGSASSITTPAFTEDTGAQSVSLTPAVGRLAASALSVILGTALVVLNPAIVTAAVPAATVIAGARAVPLDPAAIRAAVPATSTDGTRVIALSPAVARLVAPSTTPVPGVLTIGLTPAMLQAVAPSTTMTMGDAPRAPAPALMVTRQANAMAAMRQRQRGSLTAIAAFVEMPAAGTVMLTPAVLRASAVGPAMLAGGRTVPLTPAAGRTAVPSASVAPGARTVALTPAVARLAVPPLSSNGSTVVALSPGIARLGAPAPLLVAGAVSVPLQPVPARLVAAAIGVVNLRTVVLSPATLRTGAPAVVLVPGAVVRPLSPAAAVLVVPDATLWTGALPGDAALIVEAPRRARVLSTVLSVAVVSTEHRVRLPGAVALLTPTLRAGPMAANIVYVKRGDRFPAIVASLTGGPGDTPQDLTGASVVFTMQRRRPPGTVRSGACVVTDAASGEVRYDWAVGDTDIAGTYDGEFRVTLSNGLAGTFPNNRYVTIVIADPVVA